MSETVLDVCLECNGDGGWSYPRAPFGGDPNVIDWAWDWCAHCDGEGFVEIDAEPADEDWMLESLESIAA